MVAADNDTVRIQHGLYCAGVSVIGIRGILFLKN
jgi:hypothetical protein